MTRDRWLGLPQEECSHLTFDCSKYSQARGLLDGLASILSDPSLLIYLSSRPKGGCALLANEGTQSSLSECLCLKANRLPALPIEDIQGVQRGRDEPWLAPAASKKDSRELFAFFARYIRTLLARGRASDEHPGELDAGQKWIGGTRPGSTLFSATPRRRSPSA